MAETPAGVLRELVLLRERIAQIERYVTTLEPTGGGGGAALSDDLPLALGAAAAGAGAEASRDDHVHPTTGLVLTSDSRLTDARAPTAHAATHASGGGDAVTLAESQVTGLVADLAAKAADADVVHDTGAETVAGAKTFTSPLLLPDGALATPGAAFSADPNTGIRRSAADELRLVTGGADRVILDASGNVILAGTKPLDGPNFTAVDYTQIFAQARIAGDTQNRVELYPFGALWFGDGSAVTDAGIDRRAGATPLLDMYAGGRQLTLKAAGPHRVVGNNDVLVGLDALAAIAAPVGPIANTETLVLAAVIPAGQMQVGTTFRIRASGVSTAAGASAGSTFRIRIGTTTLTGNIAASLAGTSAAGTAIPFAIECLVTVRTAGASGTVLGVIVYNSNAPTGNMNVTIAVGQATTAVALDTTAAKRVELTYISGASGTNSTFHNAVIELVKA